jgi:MraZ protein
MLAASDLVLVPGTEDCLWLYTDEEYQKLTEPLEQNPFDEEYDLLRDLFIAGAEDIEVDNSGRIRVPAEQRDFASLAKEVTIVGKGPRLELWDSDSYKQRLSTADRKTAIKVLDKASKAEQST